MDLFEILFLRSIVRYLGLRTRWIIQKLIGKPMSLQELRGEGDDLVEGIGSEMFNAVLGIIVLCIIFFGGFYFYFLISDWINGK